MATFYKRDNKWRVQVITSTGRKSKTFKTKKEAQVWALSFDELDHCDIPFKKFALRYLEEVSMNKKDYRNDELRINRILKEPFSRLIMSDITSRDVANFQIKLKDSVSNSTINRYTSCISAIFNYAIRDLHLLKTNPCSFVKALKEPKPRDRRINNYEINAVLKMLNYDHHFEIVEKRQQVAIMFLLALETGMRLGEMCKLKWSDVYLDQCYLKATNTKNGDDRDIPLSSEAVRLLQKMQNINKEKVFNLSSVNASALFRKYLKTTSIRDLHFHDTRHEAITRLARKLDVLDLARMIGHRDLKSLMIYYNATASEIAKRLD